MLTKPETSDIPALKRIWKNTFNDTDEYINLFFENKFNRQKCFVYKEKNQIFSVLYYFDIILSDGKNKFKTAYICGIATLPQMRGKGLAGALIDSCLNELKSNSYDIAILIPASQSLFSYYRKFGFEEFSYISCWNKEHIKESIYRENVLSCIRTDDDIGLLKKCYGTPLTINGISYYKTNENEYTALEYTEFPFYDENNIIRTAYNPKCKNSFPFSAAVILSNIKLPEKKYINLLLN